MEDIKRNGTALRAEKRVKFSEAKRLVAKGVSNNGINSLLRRR